MDEAPSSSMDKFSTGSSRMLAWALGHMSDFNLSWRKKIDSRDGLVTYRDLSLGSTNVDSSEVGVVGEEGVVWRSHGQLHLW